MSNRRSITLERNNKYIEAATTVRDPECAFHLKILSRAFIALELGDRDRISKLIEQSTGMNNPNLESILQEIEQSASSCKEPTFVQDLASSDTPATELTSGLVHNLTHTIPSQELPGKEAVQLQQVGINSEQASLTPSFQQQMNPSKQFKPTAFLLTTENTGVVGDMLKTYQVVKEAANKVIVAGTSNSNPSVRQTRQIPAPA